MIALDSRGYQIPFIRAVSGTQKCTGSSQASTAPSLQPGVRGRSRAATVCCARTPRAKSLQLSPTTNQHGPLHRRVQNTEATSKIKHRRRRVPCRGRTVTSSSSSREVWILSEGARARATILPDFPNEALTTEIDVAPAELARRVVGLRQALSPGINASEVLLGCPDLLTMDHADAIVGSTLSDLQEVLPDICIKWLVAEEPAVLLGGDITDRIRNLCKFERADLDQLTEDLASAQAWEQNEERWQRWFRHLFVSQMQYAQPRIGSYTD